MHYGILAEEVKCVKLTFFGTGSGTRYPAVWCACEHCAYARAAGGRNIRANCSALLDGDVLLDMNAETFGSADRFGMPLLDADHLLVTHAHGDHFAPDWLVWRRMTPGIEALEPEEQRLRFASRYTRLPRLTVCGNRHVARMLEEMPELSLSKPEQSLSFQLLEAGVTYALKEDLHVTPIAAEHGPEGFTLNYILQREGRTLLYALDTGGYPEASLEVLRRFRYDLVVMEGTFGPAFARKGHMTLDKNLEMLRFFMENALWSGAPRFYLSHLSPHWTPPHDQFAEMVAPYGMQVAYDGLTLDV